MPLIWLLAAGGIGFGAGWWTSNKTTLLLIGGAGVAAYIYTKNKGS
jgi:4-hydroxybenzoate polyprenyltransferase